MYVHRPLVDLYYVDFWGEERIGMKKYEHQSEPTGAQPVANPVVREWAI